MRSYRLPLLLVSLILATVSASGATFVVRSDRDLVERADAIVIASALTSYTRLTDAGGVETVTPMSIEETIKGSVPSTADVVEPGGAYKKQVMIVPGSPQFAEGQRMLLFLMSTGPDRWSVLDLVVGKFTFATDKLGQKLLLRDEDEIIGWDPDLGIHKEPRRAADKFLEFVRGSARGQKLDEAPADYSVPFAEVIEQPRFHTSTQSLQPVSQVAPYTATSYTMTISGSQGSRWNVFPNAVNWYMGTTQEPGAPAGGATAIQAGIAAWDSDSGSNVNYVYAGADDGSHTQGLHGADGRNTVLFERDLSSFGAGAFTCNGSSYSGTLGLGGISSASGSNTVGGETFVTTQEGDVEMNKGLANCTILFNSGDFNSAVAHELGHTLGFRHSDQNRASSGSCSSDPSLECSSSAIMTASVTHGLNAALQQWDINAVRAVYPGTTGGGCTGANLSVTASANPINRGSSTTLTANSDQTVTYQWYLGLPSDTSTPLGTGKTLTVTPTTTTSYWVRITNSCGAQTSGSITITVVQPGGRKAKSDFDGDGKSDLVLQNSSTSGITVWLMNGTQPSLGVQIDTPGGTWVPVATGDLDGDGHADIIIRDSSGNIGVYLMATSGTAPKGVFLIGNPNSQYQVITTADFNRDGKDDIVLQNSVTATVVIWFMSGSSIISSSTVATPDTAWKLLASGDLDADGIPDLILQNSVSGSVTLWKMASDGTIQSGQSVGSVDPSWHVIASGDFNGDFRDDIVLQNVSTGAVTVWLMNGFTITNGHVIGSPGTSWVVKGRGDFNGDGTYDIVLQNSSTKAVVVWLMSGGNIATSGSQIQPSNVYNLMVSR